MEPGEEYGFYHGYIAREEAERRLHVEGLVEGMFLVRAKDTTIDLYALSVVENGAVHHYLIHVSAPERLRYSSGLTSDLIDLREQTKERPPSHFARVSDNLKSPIRSFFRD